MVDVLQCCVPATRLGAFVYKQHTPAVRVQTGLIHVTSYAPHFGHHVSFDDRDMGMIAIIVPTKSWNVSRRSFLAPEVEQFVRFSFSRCYPCFVSFLPLTTYPHLTLSRGVGGSNILNTHVISHSTQADTPFTSQQVPSPP